MLSDQQIERYSRQIILPQLGSRGQQRLLGASVAVVGRDDFSAAAAVYLAAAGVGKVAAPPSAVAALAAVNPDCVCAPLPASITRTAAVEIAGTSNAVLACGACDDTCMLLNAACVAARTPLVWGQARGSIGRVAVLAGTDANAPCYTCLLAHRPQERPPDEQTAALAEATAAFSGMLQATETIKLLLGLHGTPVGRVLTYDGLAATVTTRHVARNPSCATCGAPRA